MNDTKALAAHYHREGYVILPEMISAAAADRARERCLEALGMTEESGRHIEKDVVNFHSIYPWCFDIAQNLPLLDALEAILGEPNIMLWSSMIWYKEPRYEKFIPWHQDALFWPNMEPVKAVTAWVALGDVTPLNGGLKIAPGRRTQTLPHPEIHHQQSQLLIQCESPERFDEDAVDIVLKSGDVCLFDAYTLHSSGPNQTDRARIGCTLRYTTPEVKLNTDKWRRYRPEACMVRGQDRHRLNKDAEIQPPGIQSPA